MQKIADDVLETDDLGITGLRFVANRITDLRAPSTLFSLKLSSSEGPLISDFVTHEEAFKYSTYGIHVGQIDRLTFMGGLGTPIIGHFVDCRAGSPTAKKHVSLAYSASFRRHIVIPHGVAHTFDNLEHVLTRDEPIWFADSDNPAWSFDNDLISVSRTTAVDRFPLISPNRHRLPDVAHQLVSRISQRLLEVPKSYLSRFPVQIAGEQRYATFEPKSWVDDDTFVNTVLAQPIGVAGVTLSKCRYALTGPESFTVVPNTGVGVCDILRLERSMGAEETFWCHPRTTKLYTFMSNKGAKIDVALADTRKGSESEGRYDHFSIPADPRIVLTIPNGVAYSFKAPVDLIVRCEHNVFADEQEPRSDIPAFGQDVIPLTQLMISEGWRVQTPKLKCPDIVVYKLAKAEIALA